MLKNKNILIGITGSIAIYKITELIRLYIKAQANVRVIMSSGATKFITTLTFETLTRNEVITDNSESWSSDKNHIDLGKWADIFIIAPATANTINKLSNGIADNLLLQTALAYSGKKILAPSANTNMMRNPITTASIKMLKLINFNIIEPQSKLLICGDDGYGAMANIDEIYHQSIKELNIDSYWQDRRIIISGGGTIEKIDDVRFISNFSSGKMANNLALALYYKGASVCLVTSKPSSLPESVHTIEVQSTKEYKKYLIECINVAKKGLYVDKNSLIHESQKEIVKKKPYLFMAAAISDYIPSFPHEGKIKKNLLGEEWDLKMKLNSDLLDELDKSDIFSYGFKAELDGINAKENAKNMLKNKNLDGVILNILNSSTSFGSDDNELFIFDKNQEHHIKKDSKLNISLKLLDTIKKSG